MDDLFDQIRGTLAAGFPYAAILIALTIPDVCAALALPPEAREDKNKSRYITWYNANVLPKINILSGEDCYSLRCGVLHSGRSGNKNRSYDKLLFVQNSQADQISFSNGVIDDKHYNLVIGLDISYFLESMISAAEEWLEANAQDHNILVNRDRLVKVYPDGILPFVYGKQCIS